MKNLIEIYEKKQIEKLVANKRIPTFRSGDTLKVTIKIVEGERSRLQSFEGVCIARKNNGLNSNITVRKLSHGEGVERIIPLFSPSIDKIEVLRKGDVKRSKLYYLRKRKGKSARINDRDRGNEKDQYELKEEIVKDQSPEKNIETKDSSNVEKKIEIKEDKPQQKDENNTTKEEQSELSSKKIDKSENETKS
ncbi:MAG: 50S ribosomal protein L19 [Alphaproteobacteria bacterium MarineAlpha5_Bin9]|nr:MAG: 50S ribosomal protein L19 [Alphaproteobacteria bacterium MarineAlpha5_Bin9]|tara:strand:+ start:834 stop:1412 length:579 start_codon:yes stop_codon:yes gene_type:complete